MICPFCKNECPDHKNRERHFNKTLAIENYHCQACNEQFLVWEHIEKGCYAIEHKDFRIYCDPEKNHCQIQKLYMEIESDTSVMYRWYSILEMNAIPQNLTVDTVEENLKTILLFS